MTQNWSELWIIQEHFSGHGFLVPRFSATPSKSQILTVTHTIHILKIFIWNPPLLVEPYFHHLSSCNIPPFHLSPLRHPQLSISTYILLHLPSESLIFIFFTLIFTPFTPSSFIFINFLTSYFQSLPLFPTYLFMESLFSTTYSASSFCHSLSAPQHSHTLIFPSTINYCLLHLLHISLHITGFIPLYLTLNIPSMFRLAM